MSLRAISTSLLLAAMPVFCGCAVMKAANQPGKKDLSVFSPGVPRSHLIAEIGPPLSTQDFTDGSREDVFKFRQGYSKKVRVGRAIAHGAADLATGFMWELAGTPLEMIADGTEVKTVVRYDPQGAVESYEVLEGEKAFMSKGWGVARAGGAATRSAAETPYEVSPYNRNRYSDPHRLTPVGGATPETGETSLE